MKTFLNNVYFSIKGRLFQVLWISVIVYVFYDTFIYYKEAPQFSHLRNVLGIGLCISRGSATVLNISCALVLLPLCKKLNSILYRMLSKICAGLFFFWLEKSKSFHMTVASTLVLFAVIHSISHFVNLWNFSRNYNDEVREINLASYRNENPMWLLLKQPVLTGILMLIMTSLMAMTSSRAVRAKCYNAFWYTHHLYLPFIVLLIVHPMGGVLKEEVLSNNVDYDSSQAMPGNTTRPEFVPIKSTTVWWMVVPLSCFCVDLIWRMMCRNRTKVKILEASLMPGRTVSLKLSCPNGFKCRVGQYILLQCLDISLIEWHPFTVVKLPSCNERDLTVWIRVSGDWTEALEKSLLEKEPKTLSMLVDGPFFSPMERAVESQVAVCVAAGVGITPFISLLHEMSNEPKKKLPGRVHLIWIVKQESEISWLANLFNRLLQDLRDNNKPDRLNLELYVTRTESGNEQERNVLNHVVALNENGCIEHNLISRQNRNEKEDEGLCLITPKMKRGNVLKIPDRFVKIEEIYNIEDKYSLLGCRIRRGRPNWDRLFGYWTHLYPDSNLNVFCCGPKKLVKVLKYKTKHISHLSSTKFTFVHEGFC